MPEDFKVTPWEVEGKVDYDKLIQQFGTKRIDENLLKRLAKSEQTHTETEYRQVGGELGKARAEIERFQEGMKF